MLELRFVARDLRRLDEVSAEIVACGIYRDVRPFGGLAGLVDWRLAGRLSRLAREGFVLGEIGELVAVPVRPRLPFDHLLVAGLGPRSAFGDAAFREVLERMLDALEGLHAKKAVLELPGRADDAISAERAAEILFELVGTRRDALTFVEDPDDQQRIEKRVEEERHAARTDAVSLR